MIDLANGATVEVSAPNIPRIVVNNFPRGVAQAASLWVGDGPPAFIPGAKARHVYLNALTGDLFELEADMATWTPVANIKGEPGDTVLDPTERQKLLDDLVAEVDAPEPDVDLVLLFENSIA